MGPEQYYGYEQQQVYNQPDPNKKKRIIIGITGLSLFILTVMIVVASLLSSPSIKPQVTKIAAMHTEVARIADLGITSNETRRATKNLAANVKTISLNNVSQIKNWADSNLSTKLSKTGLATEMNENINAFLDSSSQQNEFDKDFKQTLSNLLTAANDEMVLQFNNFSDYPELQAILNTSDINNGLLIEALSAN